MVTHVVLFKWKEGAAPEAIERAMAALAALKGTIPGIVEFSCGANFSERSQGYHQGVVMRFVDRAALAAYVPHPEHRRVIREHLDPIRVATLVVDYES